MRTVAAAALLAFGFLALRTVAGGAPASASAAAQGVARFVPALREGDSLPDLPLVDERNRPFSLRDFGDRTIVLSFAYVRCSQRSMCPLVSARFAALQRLGANDRIALLEVTLDPAHDSPSALAAYGALYGEDPARWTLATGKPQVLAELATRAGLSSSVVAGRIVHSDAVLIVDPAGRIARIIDGNAWTPDEVLAEARASGGELPNPAVRLELWLASGAAAVCGGASGISTGVALAVFVALLVAGAFVARKYLRTVP